MKKQKFNILIVLLASLIVSYFVLKDDFSDIVSLISNINIGWLMFAFGMVVMYWFFQALCLSVVSSLSEDNLPFRTFFKSIIICHFFNGITPSASGGQPFQIYFLNRKGMKIGKASNIVVAQSTLYQVSLVLIGLIAIILNHVYNFFPPDNILRKLVIIGFIVNFMVIVILAYISFGKKTNKFIIMKLIHFLNKIKIIRNKEETLLKIERVIDSFYTSAKTLNSNKAALLKGTIYNFVGLLFLYISPLIVAYAFGNYTDLNVIVTLVSSAYVMLIGAFVPIPGGSGGIEYAFAAFFGFYIIGPTLMAMLLIWRFVTYYIPVVVGGVTFALDGNGGK